MFGFQAVCRLMSSVQPQTLSSSLSRSFLASFSTKNNEEQNEEIPNLFFPGTRKNSPGRNNGPKDPLQTGVCDPGEDCQEQAADVPSGEGLQG